MDVEKLLKVIIEGLGLGQFLHVVSMETLETIDVPI
jgi:hypothetical protein